ncbi:FadR/GntR family transcriptional regulator [Granulosicoccaceae sp. 1_MG-2023]|nr:FadR/GntR family transcriptional regulator [Granulosicoccaceae sp. 1_MG-2023]
MNTASTDNKPRGRVDLGEQVAKRVASKLLSGAYLPGERLPREIELAEQLNMSRASVRSGLQTLAALGMIYRRAGHGTVVQDTRDWNLLDSRVSDWMVEFGNPNTELVRAIYEYRRAIEPYVSALAASRATGQDLAAIEAAYNDMAGGVSESAGGAFTSADVAFHTAIYRATHNLIWVQSATILRPAILLVIEKSNSTAEELGDSLARHKRVLEAIRLRRPREAFDAAISVLDRTAHDLGMPVFSDEEPDPAALMRFHLDLPDAP